MTQSVAPRGVAGWLAWLVFAMIALGPMLSLGGILDAFRSAEAQYPTLDGMTTWEIHKAGHWVVWLISSGVSAWGGWILATKRTVDVPRTAKRCLWLSGPGSALGHLLVSLKTLGSSADVIGEALLQLLTAALGAGLWVLYLTKSKRVRNTYASAVPGADSGTIDGSCGAPRDAGEEGGAFRQGNAVHTHYDTLQVAPTASSEVIRAAYKALIQQYHPDRNPDRTKLATAVTKMLNEAYEVLSDPGRRAAYDSFLAQQQPASQREMEQRPREASPARWTAIDLRSVFGTGISIRSAMKQGMLICTMLAALLLIVRLDVQYLSRWPTWSTSVKIVVVAAYGTCLLSAKGLGLGDWGRWKRGISSAQQQNSVALGAVVGLLGGYAAYLLLSLAEGVLLTEALPQLGQRAQETWGPGASIAVGAVIGAYTGLLESADD